jgi:2-hydroxyacyl-CoA lyase 1
LIPPDSRKTNEDELFGRLKALSSDERARMRRALNADEATGHALIAEALRQCGVKRVIGITGTPVDQTFAECWTQCIPLIGARHQQAAVLMSAAANYVAGRLESAVLVSAGPAVTNALTGILVARDNGWPVIVIGGRRPVHEEGIGYFQELDAVPIYRSVTKWSTSVRRTADIFTTVIKAYEIASAGRPGPVYLDLPEDVLNQSALTDRTIQPNVPTEPGIDARVLADCADLLCRSSRPLLILGDGIRWSFNAQALPDLVERTGIPFITTPLARGFVPDDHPFCANVVRRWIQSQADVVLMAGACFDWRFRFGGELAFGAKVIHVDNDPTVLGKNLADAVTVHADAGQFLNQLRDVLPKRSNRVLSRTQAWRQHVSLACQEKRIKAAAWLQQTSEPMGPQQMFGALREFIDKDTIVVFDGNITLAAGQALLSANGPCSWLDPGWNGCMGAGIPFGIGAKLVEPNRTVVVVCGDFAFGLSAMELETAVRHQIPIIVVIMNNDGIGGRVRQQTQIPKYPGLFSQFQTGLRYEQIAGAFGGHAEYVTTAHEIQPALERAKASGKAACINVRVNPDATHPGFW